LCASIALCAGIYVSRSQALASAIVVMPASASSFGTRSCMVWNKCCERPRAWGEYARDVLDTQMCRRASNLGRLAAIHLAASFGRVKVLTAAIRVQAQRQAVSAEHLQQRQQF
jgi:hypothetical protein